MPAAAGKGTMPAGSACGKCARQRNGQPAHLLIHLEHPNMPHTRAAVKPAMAGEISVRGQYPRAARAGDAYSAAQSRGQPVQSPAPHAPHRRASHRPHAPASVAAKGLLLRPVPAAPSLRTAFACSLYAVLSLAGFPRLRKVPRRRLFLSFVFSYLFSMILCFPSCNLSLVRVK